MKKRITIVYGSSLNERIKLKEKIIKNDIEYDGEICREISNPKKVGLFKKKEQSMIEILENVYGRKLSSLDIEYDLKKLNIENCIYCPPRALSTRQKKAFSLMIDRHNNRNSYLFNDELEDDATYYPKAISWLVSHIENKEGFIIWLTSLSREEVYKILNDEFDVKSKCVFATIKNDKITYDIDRSAKIEPEYYEPMYTNANFYREKTYQNTEKESLKPVLTKNSGPGLSCEATLYNIKEGTINFMKVFFKKYDLDVVSITIGKKIYDLNHPEKGLVVDFYGKLAKIYIEGKDQEEAMNKFLVYLRDADMIDFNDYNRLIKFDDFKYVIFSYSIDDEYFEFKDVITDKLYNIDSKSIKYTAKELKTLYRFKLFLKNNQPIDLKPYEHTQEIENKIKEERERYLLEQEMLMRKKPKQEKVLIVPNLIFSLDECIHCYSCELACSNHAIKLEDENIIWDKNKCDGCMLCVSQCFMGAIKVKNN